MSGSILYLLPASRDSCILNKKISKTRSLSDLDIVHKTPSENLLVDRRNSLSGTLTIDATLSTASAVEAFVGPFKTLQEAQVAASLLKHEPSHSGIPPVINLHQNMNGTANVIQPTKCPADLNDIKVSTASTSHVVSLNESNKFSWTKPLSFLPINVQGKHEVFSPANANTTSKMQTNLHTSETSSPQVSSADNLEVRAESFLPSGKESPVGDRNNLEDSIGCAEKSKIEADHSPVKKKTRTRKKESIPSITKVASLVFFDLETTGLAFEIGKSNVQITEVSMIAIDRKEFEKSTYEDLRDIRIIQKLCLCTRPRSMVSSSAAGITGLNNENLVDQTPFERNAAEAINFFLSHLPKPICLLAHNGNRYDFPLLKAEFSRLSMSLPSDILIADTLKAFRVLGVPVFPPEKKICASVKYTKKGQVSYSLSNLHLYLFNKNPTGSHSSEGDCIALAKVCHRMKDVMLLWIDENCTTFESVSPMW